MKASPFTYLLPLAVALITGMAFFFIMGSVAKPSKMTARLEGIGQLVGRGEVIQASSRGQPNWPAKATACPSTTVMPGTYRKLLVQTSTNANLKVSLVNVAELVDGGSEMLDGLSVTFEAKGSPTDAANFMAQLADATPTLFIDSLDITPRQGGVFKLTGRVWCWRGL